MEQKNRRKKQQRKLLPREEKRKMINLVYTILCIACLIIGFFLGSKKEEPINKINPIKTIKEKVETHQAEKEIQEQLEELNKIANNIEKYDGTAEGQEEVKNIEIRL